MLLKKNIFLEIKINFKMSTIYDKQLLKESPTSLSKNYKMRRNTLYSTLETNKELPFKHIIFNPQSFISHKYAGKNLLEKKIKNKDNKIGNIENYENSNNTYKKDNQDFIYNLNSRKIKLKPLNKNRSSSQLIPKKYSVLMPSQKITQDLVRYNMLNTHNTLLNYYHKNKRNIKIINFVRNNAKEIIDSVKNQIHTYNKSSFNNSSCQVFQNDVIRNNNTNDESSNPISNLYLKTNDDKTKPSCTKKQAANLQKSKKNIELIYESELIDKKMPHNLKYFADHLFKEYQIDKISKGKNLSCPHKNLNETEKKFFGTKNSNSNSNTQLIDFKEKKNFAATYLINKHKKKSIIIRNKIVDFHHTIKNPFQEKSNNTTKNNRLENDDLMHKMQRLIFNPNTSKIGNKHIWQNSKANKENKLMSLKELRAASIKGFQKMKAQKELKFNLMVKNANKEVMALEKKLDELFENNKKEFLEEKVE